MKPHSLRYLIFGLFLIAVGVFLPRGWYDSVPPTPNLPEPPIKGITLVQLMFVLEGLALLVLCVWPRTPGPALERRAVRIARRVDGTEFIGQGEALLCLAAITVLGFALRIFRAGSDLWIDEIATVLTAGSMSALHVIASYINSGNHLLNTLLVKLSMSLFGREEWAIRLPAVLFGTAAVPAFYWVSRIGFSRIVSLAAALLLSVSYHHISFSQNARGYTAYLFFALVASGVLCRALERDSVRWWGLYVACIVLGLASLLHTVFVAAGHLIAAGAAIWFDKPRRDRSPALLKRLVAVYGIAAALAVHLYALVLPQVYMYITTTYREASAGYSLLSLDFVNEVIRGLAAGLGSGGVLLLPLLAAGGVIMAVGSFLMFRKHWLLTAELISPSVITGAFVAVNQLSASPRLFLIAIFPGILGGVVILEWFIRRLPASKNPAFFRKAFVAVVLAATVASLVPMRRYYATAKQPFRASLEYLQTERRPGDIVVSVYLSDSGYKYYGFEFGLNETNCIYVRSQEAFDRVLSEHAPDKLWIVTTLHRILEIEYPTLTARLRAEWTPVRVFPATIGGGELTVWRAK